MPDEKGENTISILRLSDLHPSPSLISILDSTFRTQNMILDRHPFFAFSLSLCHSQLLVMKKGSCMISVSFLAKVLFICLTFCHYCNVIFLTFPFQEGQHIEGNIERVQHNIPQSNVDDGLTSLSWLQNLNMCMTRLGAPTPPTPPASPNRLSITSHNQTTLFNKSASQRVPSKHFRSHNMSQGRYQTKVDHIEPRVERGGNGNVKMSQNRKEKNRLAEEGREIAPPIVDYRNDPNIKPPFSYASLICMAMKSSRNKMTLNSIYKWIRENFVYYQHADRSWQVGSLLLYPSESLSHFSFLLT